MIFGPSGGLRFAVTFNVIIASGDDARPAPQLNRKHLSGVLNYRTDAIIISATQVHTCLNLMHSMDCCPVRKQPRVRFDEVAANCEMTPERAPISQT